MNVSILSCSFGCSLVYKWGSYRMQKHYYMCGNRLVTINLTYNVFLFSHRNEIHLSYIIFVSIYCFSPLLKKAYSNLYARDPCSIRRDNMQLRHRNIIMIVFSGQYIICGAVERKTCHNHREERYLYIYIYICVCMIYHHYYHYYYKRRANRDGRA
ncbi:unnamed protein product [Aphis gossypii]|uniref:Uncharacterized protein n=1 Tax=Aphis gossypii TaxID=80765 RepID=A0A9P0J1A4_APHGO|nr:unnamed protein product [Aphis gossypii]